MRFTPVNIDKQNLHMQNFLMNQDFVYGFTFPSVSCRQVSKVSEENIDLMVKELQEKEAKRKSFSRRCRFHEEKDIDSINDRNEHFNKKIERAFGKYTLEIKNNLERGTALPD